MKARDVDFKLHAPGRTTVECPAGGGKVIGLRVVPEGRSREVVVAEGFEESGQ